MSSPSLPLTVLIERWLRQPGARWVVLAGDRGTAKSSVLQLLAARCRNQHQPFVWWEWPPPYRTEEWHTAVPDPQARWWLLDEWMVFPHAYPCLDRGVLAIESARHGPSAPQTLPGRWPFAAQAAVAWVTLRRHPEDPAVVIWEWDAPAADHQTGVVPQGPWAPRSAAPHPLGVAWPPVAWAGCSMATGIPHA